MKQITLTINSKDLHKYNEACKQIDSDVHVIMKHTNENLVSLKIQGEEKELTDFIGYLKNLGIDFH